MNRLKKILILGAGEGQMPLIRRSKAAGWFTIVVSPKGNYPGFIFADQTVFADISNTEDILQIAIQEEVDAVATDQTDISVPTVQYVCEKLGLPCIKCQDIENFQKKSRMREICQKYGIPTIPYQIAHTINEAESFLNKISPSAAIIKPVDSQGSRGVKKVVSSDELNKAWGEAISYSKSNQVIIERFVEGQEVEVDTVIREGKIIDVLIGDVYNFKGTFSGYERIYPTQYTPEIQNTIKKVNASTLKALGIQTGWTHGEYMVTNSGEVFLIEVGARGGGNYIGSDIVNLMLGVGTDEMSFRNAIGDMSFYDEVHLRNNFCAYKCFYLPKGIVESVEVEDSLFYEDYVVMHNLSSLKVGMKTLGNNDKTTRYTLVVVAENHSQLRERLDSIPNRIKVRVLTPNGIKSCIWK